MNRCYTFTLIVPIINVIFLILPVLTYAGDTPFDEIDGYFKVVWGMLIVLGIMLLMYGLLRKRLSIFHSNSSQSIKVLEIKPIMPKKSLCLVEVKGEEYLLGISADRISHIATLPKDTSKSFEKTLNEVHTERLK